MMWLRGGQFWCDEHRPVQCIPFFLTPGDAVCAECSHNAPGSYLSPKTEFERQLTDTERELAAQRAKEGQ